jgi:pilus assembly protein CpaB
VADIEDFLTTERIPEKIAPEGVIADLVQVQGQLVAADIFPGETLVAGRFVAPEQFSARRGAVEVPECLLEVTIAMSQEQFIGGVPVPGDKVAVIVNGPRSEFIAANIDPLAQAGGAGGDPAANADTTSLTLTKIILQQALVTNVQGNALPTAPAVQSATDRVAPAEGSVLVTLALDGPDTERLLYVRDSQSLNANLHMALHNGDAQVISEGISVENIINPEAPVG